MRKLLILFLALMLQSAPVSAAPLDPTAPVFNGQVIPDFRTSPIFLRARQAVYDVSTPDQTRRLGLLGLRDAEVGQIVSKAAIDSMLTGSGASPILSILAGSNAAALNPGLSEFDDISDGVNITSLQRESDGRIWAAIWVLWEGDGNLTFTSATRGGVNTLSAGVTQPGNPLPVTAAVPLPAPAWLLLAALAGLFAPRLRRRRATCETCPG